MSSEKCDCEVTFEDDHLDTWTILFLWIVAVVFGSWGGCLVHVLVNGGM